MLKLKRDQTRSEEVLNAFTHFLGLIFSIVSGVILMYLAVEHGNLLHVLSALVFSLSMFFLYGSSTVYHYLKESDIKKIFRKLDHASIYIFIASSYTLVVLQYMELSEAWLLLAGQWIIAIGGSVYEVFQKNKSSLVGSIIYLMMGWMIVAFYPQLMALPGPVLQFIFAGGVCYSVGVIFYLLDNKYHYFHAVWHLFVLAGTVMHFIMGTQYAYI